MLSNAEREKLVLDLYNQVKNIRHLPKESRISFRDINTLFKESGRQPQSENSKKQSADDKATKIVVDKAIQAYKLFSEGKKQIQVAIALGLDRKETTGMYRDA